MTCNIKHGRTNAACTQPTAMPGQPPAPDCNLDLQAAVAVIREHDPDIIGLQEIDRVWARSGYQDEPPCWPRRSGWSIAATRRTWNIRPTFHSDRPHEYGTLILSRFPIPRAAPRRRRAPARTSSAALRWP